MKKIMLEFSSRQMEELLRLVYLGDWILNSHKPGNKPSSAVRETEEIVYRAAVECGLGKFIEYEPEHARSYPTAKLDKLCHDDIEKYDALTFFEAFAGMLAERALENKHGVKSLKRMDPDELFVETEQLADELKEKIAEKIPAVLDAVLEKAGVKA